MTSFLLFLGVAVLVVVGLGRIATPDYERVPLRLFRSHDWVDAGRRGLDLLTAGGRRRGDHLEHVAEEQRRRREQWRQRRTRGTEPGEPVG